MRRTRVTLWMIPFLGIAACEGEVGPVGPEGTPGADGTPCYQGLADQNGDGVIDVLDCRIAGVNGLDCWDLNGNGVGDVALEDVTGDGVVDARDCVGPAGDDGQACWDLNGNGVGDPAVEDANGDGVVDVLDCAGPPGDDNGFGPAVYVGSSACESCHPDVAYRAARTGHGNALREPEGAQPPPALQANLGMSDVPANGNHPAAPPAGYDWTDVSYVIGAWGLMAQFIDDEGYLITCPPGDEDDDGDGFCDAECAGSTPGTCDAATFADKWSQASDTWMTKRAGEADVPFDCAACHTTGYDPTGVTLDAGGDPIPGVIGSWHEAGVQCEACHGPGSRHIADPFHGNIEINRDAEACGRCHTYVDVRSIPADGGGFIKHTGQWNELFASKKHVMDCIDCHNPHQSAQFADTTLLPSGEEATNPDRSIQIACGTCHYDEAARQNNLTDTGDSPMKQFVDCIDCHMPRLTRGAEGDVDNRMGDVRTHLFGINTDPTAPQFTVDGEHAMPYVTLEWSCRSCHPPSEAQRGTRLWSVRSDAQLEQSAVGYHD